MAANDGPAPQAANDADGAAPGPQDANDGPAPQAANDGPAPQAAAGAVPISLDDLKITKNFFNVKISGMKQESKVLQERQEKQAAIDIETKEKQAAIDLKSTKEKLEAENELLKIRDAN